MRLRYCARRARSAVLLAVVLAAVPAATQSVSAPGLKAAYLLNFARFVEWPAEIVPAEAPLVLCIVNDGAVASALEQAINGRSVQNRSLSVVRLVAGASLPMCHVVYLAASEPKHALDVIAALDGRLVLTVSDTPRFAQTGGMVELFVEQGRLRIVVNVDALQRAKVRLSSRVLALATIVRDAVSQ